jgi:hypothetical protein
MLGGDSGDVRKPVSNTLGAGFLRSNPAGEVRPLSVDDPHSTVQRGASPSKSA